MEKENLDKLKHFDKLINELKVFLLYLTKSHNKLLLKIHLLLYQIAKNNKIMIKLIHFAYFLFDT